MQIESFSYSDYAWQLNGLNLNTVNLIVGKNASGKSRTLTCIDLLANILSQKREISTGGTWKVRFLTLSKEVLDYSIAKKSSGIITREVLAVGGKILLDRSGTSCRVYSKSTNREENFFPPENQLAVHVRRDIKAFPDFERLIEWATNAYGFKFGSISPANALAFSGYDLMNPVEDLVDMYQQLTEFQKENILELMRQMGYKINAINPAISTDSRLLEVNEEGIEKPITHTRLSQGMFRMVVLLIYLTYLIGIKRPQLITIDDFGEGLDYQRVTHLGKYVFEACKQAEIQLIATSNDGLLMDTIPLESWNVLIRKGTEVNAINTHNNSDLFDNFIFTGLSNFDFFSSDYILSRLK